MKTTIKFVLVIALFANLFVALSAAKPYYTTSVDDFGFVLSVRQSVNEKFHPLLVLR